MRLNPRCVLVLTLLLMPTTSWASDHVASMFGAYSNLSGSRHSGLLFGLEVSWPTTGRIHDHLGILVDAGVHGGTDAAGDKFTKAAILFGLRAIYKIPPLPRVVAFAHGLVGGHRSQTGTAVVDGWARGVGAGGEVRVLDTTHGAWAVRGQVDWIYIARETRVRTSAGVAFRFK